MRGRGGVRGGGRGHISAFLTVIFSANSRKNCQFCS